MLFWANIINLPPHLRIAHRGISSVRSVNELTVKPKVYALSTCPYCKRTRRFLDDHKIAYDCIEVDLLDDAKQDVVLDEIEKMTGRRSFPVVIVGKEIIVGHDEDKLRKVFKI